MLEATPMTRAIQALLSARGGRVTVSNPMPAGAIASAQIKTGKIDVKVLSQLGAGARARTAPSAPFASLWALAVSPSATRRGAGRAQARSSRSARL